MKGRTNFLLLKAIREKGITQVDLVHAARLASEARLSRIMRNRCQATPDEIKRIAKVLKVSVSELGLEDSQKSNESSAQLRETHQ